MATVTGLHPAPNEPGNLERSHWNAGLAWTTLLSLSKGQGQTLPQLSSPLLLGGVEPADIALSVEGSQAQQSPLTGRCGAFRHCPLCRRLMGSLPNAQISLPHA